MSLIEIKHWNGTVLHTIEADSLRAAIIALVKSGADLSWANLSWADLSWANLSGADLSWANLSGANLYGADLSRANLSRANLYGANLYGADLSRANLSGADLYGANLSGADLSWADLSWANLSGANLSGADLSWAKGIDPYRCTPLLMLLDQPGKIRAYKLVNRDSEGPYNGGIKYEIGKTVSEPKACTDVNQQCAAGISLATLDWCMREWRKGYRILVCEFTTKDIAAIPTANDGKFRVFRCKVVAEKDLKEIGVIKEVEEAK